MFHYGGAAGQAVGRDIFRPFDRADPPHSSLDEDQHLVPVVHCSISA
jgi:hypothetical protein